MFIGRERANVLGYSKKHYENNNKFVNLFCKSASIAKIALNGKIQTSGVNYVTQTAWHIVNPVLWLWISFDHKNILSNRKFYVLDIHRIH